LGSTNTMKPSQLIALAASLCLALTVAAQPDALESGFQHPPDSAKPQTWWHWMNGNITRAGITADLEAMKRAGEGGATIVNVDCGIPRGPVDFMSPEWREMFKFAVSEASRLGLELCVENGAGWSSSGGPWNTPEHGMQRVTTSEVHLVGPQHFSAPLPQPPTTLDFYRDVAVLAFPAVNEEIPRMGDLSPTVTTSSGEAPGNRLTDGDSATYISMPVPTPDHPQYAQLAFPQPFGARAVTIGGRADMPACSGEILVSDDGQTFRSVAPFLLGKGAQATRTFSLGTQLVSARYWRVQFNAIGKKVKVTTIPLAEISLSPRLTIDNIEAKAGFNGSAVLSAPDSNPQGSGAIPRAQVLDLSDKLRPDGKLDWQVPPGNWVVLRVGHTPTGVKNHPAPKEGEGLECDKFSKAALDAHWAGFMQKVLDDLGPLAGARALDSSLIDSYEVGGQNWTEAFRKEFQQRRGYDLLPFLPAFTGRVIDSPAVTERFLWDIRRTIADLFAENYYGHFAELCHQHGLTSAVEPYTGPFESLQVGGSADFVMGEFWSGSSGHPSIKLASSIAHIYGKIYVGAESFTAQPEAGRWQNDPYSLKTLGDLMYCQGLNRYVFHRYAMQPWTNRWPGMTMGQWGFHFERTVTWWDQGQAWLSYIAHCQFLLQQGRFVADAAYFTGESAPVEMRVGDPALPAGYDYDAINADVLLHGASVQNGRLTLASGASYAVLILPPHDVDLTPATLQCLHDLVLAGATIVGPRPEHSPSLTDYPNCDLRVNQLAAELWGDCDGVHTLDHAAGQGHVYWGKPLDDVFAAQQLSPDFEVNSASARPHLAYAHRVAGDTDIYFVSNQRRQFDAAEVTFRTSGRVPELWHPETGEIEPAPVWTTANGRTTVLLNFEPAESVFVVFRHAAVGADHLVHVHGMKESLPAAAMANPAPQWETHVTAEGSVAVRTWANGEVEFQTAVGNTLKMTATNLPPPLSVDGTWNLAFPPNWGAPASVSLDHLISWSDHPDAGVRYFSGTATYKKIVEIPADRLADGRELWLDLGEVKNFAEVEWNGQNLGVLWKPPFRVNVTAAAQPGANQLVVKVTNLWPNRLIGDEQLPPDVEWEGKQLKEWPQWLLDGKPSPTGRLTFTTWHHWTKDSPLLESGLLGPVTLSTAEIIPAYLTGCTPENGRKHGRGGRAVLAPSPGAASGDGISVASSPFALFGGGNGRTHFNVAACQSSKYLPKIPPFSGPEPGIRGNLLSAVCLTDSVLRHQVHAALRAVAWCVGDHLRVHGADKHRRGIGARRRGGSLRGVGVLAAATAGEEQGGAGDDHCQQRDDQFQFVHGLFLY